MQLHTSVMPELPATFQPHGGSAAPRRERNRERENRRGSAASRGYDKDWRRVRLAVLDTEPCCRVCMSEDRVTPAVLVDHIVPLDIAPERRLDRTNLQPLCTLCHAIKTADDMARYRRAGDSLDEQLLWPSWLVPSRVPLTIVCGPAASGKSTWVRERAKPCDTVIDVDLIHRELTGGETRRRSKSDLARALARRNAMLGALGQERRPGAAFLIVAAPNPDERDKWARMLEPRTVAVMETPAEECIRRIEADPERSREAEWMVPAVLNWWRRYRPRPGDLVVPWLGGG
jgi:5-methylcytosine-specific restriction protein A